MLGSERPMKLHEIVCRYLFMLTMILGCAYIYGTMSLVNTNFSVMFSRMETSEHVNFLLMKAAVDKLDYEYYRMGPDGQKAMLEVEKIYKLELAKREITEKINAGR